MLRTQGKQVEYSLRALPLAGYVAFPDNVRAPAAADSPAHSFVGSLWLVQDPKSKIPKDDRNLLKNRSILTRAIVLSAGVVANTIFAWSILFAQVLPMAVAKAGCTELKQALRSDL